MATPLDELIGLAKAEATRSGFRTCGIYHLLRAVQRLDPEPLMDLLAAREVDAPHFLKAVENVLRPRRAGGGIPRDRLDAELLDEALQKARAAAQAAGVEPNSLHLLGTLADLKEDPVWSLCDRYLIEHARDRA